MKHGGKRKGAGRKPGAHGGKRPGAGRKPGSLARRTRKIAEQAVAEGITPLEVMLHAMRECAAHGNWTGAADIARMAAPYVHPKLQAIEHSGPNGSALTPKRLEIVFVKSEAPDLDELLKDD